jgi:predicted DNA-binding transcriptional regulator AlpA
MAIERRFFSCKEVAALLGLSAKHVNDLCLKKIIPSTKLSGRRLIDFKVLQERLALEAAGRGPGK